MMVHRILAVLVLLVAPAMAGTVTFISDVSAAGTVSSSTQLTVSGCNIEDALAANTFASAALSDRLALQGNQYGRSFTNTYGVSVVSDSMSSMAWSDPCQSCCGKTCETKPGYFTMTHAQATAMLVGPGSVSSVAAPNTLGITATGTGMYTFNAGVLDMRQVTGDDGTIRPCLDTTQFGHGTTIIGKYGVTQYFTYR